MFSPEMDYIYHTVYCIDSISVGLHFRISRKRKDTNRSVSVENDAHVASHENLADRKLQQQISHISHVSHVSSDEKCKTPAVLQDKSKETDKLIKEETSETGRVSCLKTAMLGPE